jgi:2-(1,2-epoxy-1,2-dihydrophenyl)acetyl-CoA isomerase
MMPNSEYVQSELKSGVLSITLNHPKVNAFTREMIFSIQKIFEDAAREAQVRCLLLTGSGDVFSAGHDLNEVFQVRDESFRDHLARTFNHLIIQIRSLEKPVIAAINGPVAGAALGVALACDLRIASEEVQFLVGFLGVGLNFDSGVSLILPKLIGLGRATEYSFTNDPISAQQALEWGLVSRLAPAEEFMHQAEDWAGEIARGPVHTMGLAKRALNNAHFANLEQVLEGEAQIQDIARRGAEFEEGLRAFLEKRSPNFT